MNGTPAHSNQAFHARLAWRTTSKRRRYRASVRPATDTRPVAKRSDPRPWSLPKGFVGWLDVFFGAGAGWESKRNPSPFWGSPKIITRLLSQKGSLENFRPVEQVRNGLLSPQKDSRVDRIGKEPIC